MRTIKLSEQRRAVNKYKGNWNMLRFIKLKLHKKITFLHQRNPQDRLTSSKRYEFYTKLILHTFKHVVQSK